MSSESEIFDSVFSYSSDSELPSTLVVSDGDNEYEPRDVTNQSRHPSLAPLNRVHSLEPPEFDSELPATPSEEMDASFQAALQLLDDTFNVDFSSETLHATTSANLNGDTSSTSASDPDDSSASFTNAPISLKQLPTSKPRRRHRISTKQQIDNLRGTIGELTKQLDLMRTGSSQAESVDTETQSSEVASMWQDIAARQLARRQEAESDNAKLRVMLDLQVQEAKNLKRILKRRTRIEMLEEMLGVKRHKLLESEKPESSITVLQEVLQSVDEFYFKVDSEFANKKMDQVQCPGKRRTANRLATNGVMLEILQKQLVPFQAKMTEKAVWAALGKIAMQPLHCIKDINAHVDFYAQTLE